MPMENIIRRERMEQAGVPNRNVNLSMSPLVHLVIPFSGETGMVA
jgi:hypothetical protein